MKLTTILWRDIPSQVIVRAGRNKAKQQLSHRFQAAIDRAAMRAGKGGSRCFCVKRNLLRVVYCEYGDHGYLHHTAHETERIFTGKSRRR